MITRCEMPTGLWSYYAVSLFSVLLSESRLLLFGVRWRPWARDGARLFLDVWRWRSPWMDGWHWGWGTCTNRKLMNFFFALFVYLQQPFPIEQSSSPVSNVNLKSMQCPSRCKCDHCGVTYLTYMAGDWLSWYKRYSSNRRYLPSPGAPFRNVLEPPYHVSFSVVHRCSREDTCIPQWLARLPV